MNEDVTLYQLGRYAWQKKRLIVLLSLIGFFLSGLVIQLRSPDVIYQTAVEIGSYYDTTNQLGVKSYLESVSSLSTKVVNVYIPIVLSQLITEKSVSVTVTSESGSPLLFLVSKESQFRKHEVEKFHNKIIELIARDHLKVIDNVVTFHQSNLQQLQDDLTYLNADSSRASRLQEINKKIRSNESDIKEIEIQHEIKKQQLESKKIDYLSKIVDIELKVSSLISKIKSLISTKNIIGEQIESNEKLVTNLSVKSPQNHIFEKDSGSSLAAALLENSVLESENVLWDLKKSYFSTIDYQIEVAKNEKEILNNKISTLTAALNELPVKEKYSKDTMLLKQTSLNREIASLKNEANNIEINIDREEKRLVRAIKNQELLIKEIHATEPRYVALETKSTTFREKLVVVAFGIFFGAGVALMIIFFNFSKDLSQGAVPIDENASR